MISEVFTSLLSGESVTIQFESAKALQSFRSNMQRFKKKQERSFSTIGIPSGIDNLVFNFDSQGNLIYKISLISKEEKLAAKKLPYKIIEN